jgi:hypothetical protein
MIDSCKLRTQHHFRENVHSEPLGETKAVKNPATFPGVSRFGGIVLSQCAAACVYLIRGDTSMNVKETFPTGSMAKRSLPSISTRSSRALPQPASASGNHRVAWILPQFLPSTSTLGLPTHVGHSTEVCAHKSSGRWGITDSLGSVPDLSCYRPSLTMLTLSSSF